jgi:dUTP pyrophosphatase
MPDWLLRLFGRKVRGFEVVAHWARQTSVQAVQLPTRGTSGAAAYDIYALDSKTIRPGGKVEFPTDVKVYMRKDEVFHLYPRSNQGIKFDLMLANTTGVIDTDYYENEQNDGRFTIVLRNLGSENYYVKAGDRIAQGEFAKFLVADNDYNKKLPTRKGGTGSTGR